MFSWFEDRGKRGLMKGGRVCINKEIVEHFSCYTISLNILEFTQCLISSIIVPQHSTKCECLQTFQKKLFNTQSTVYSCLVFNNTEMGTSEKTGISVLFYIPSLQR
jgi:hypothetical protein